MVHQCIRWSHWTKYSSDNGSDNRMLNQMKDICCECTLRGMLAKLLSRRESQSSRLVLTRSMSAWRLLATHKTGVFIAKKWQEIMCGVYDVICAALWWWSGHFGGKHIWTHSQAVFPLFLKGYGYSWQFVIGLGWSGHYTWCDTIHWTRLHWLKPKNS